MVIDLFLIIVAVLWLIVACTSDIKTREVPNWLVYSLIIIALGLRAIGSLISGEWLFFIWGLAGFAGFAVIGNLMYYARQWGGGDAKLFMGMGALFGSYLNIGLFSPVLNIPFALVLLINTLIVGGFYGLCFATVLAIINRKKFLKELKTCNIGELKIVWILAIAIAVISLVFLRAEFLLLGLIIGLFVFLTAHLLFFVKVVEKVSMQKWISPKQLTEGDWIAHDVLVKGKVICSAKSLGVENKDINRLLKAKVKKVLIKQGLPFVPSFFIAVIASLIFGNLLWFLF